MGLNRLTTSDAPVTQQELSDHLRLDDSQDDGTLGNVLETATDFLERETRQALRPCTYRLTMDGWPAGRVITIPTPPLVSVESITYLDPLTDQTLTLNPALYRVDTDTKPGRVVLRAGHGWPATIPDANAVTVNFTAGYTNNLPYTLRQGILLLAALYFEQREAALDRTVTELPLAVQSIVAMHQFPEAC